MPRSRRPGSAGCWPDERQTLLLKAAVWQDERALAAWERWCEASALEQVGAAEMPTLAAAYRRLRGLGVDDPMLSIARGVYKRSWFMNQLALRRAASVVEELRAAGIEVLVLKGAALTLLHYRDLGARPMDDIDLLPRPGSLDAAVGVLIEAGWRVLQTQGEVSGPLRYGTHVEDEQGNQTDLHEFALMQSVDDSDLWETRVPLALMGTDAFALAPAEQLLHVCAHGMRWEPGASHWAVDAMTILRRTGPDLDWRRLVQRAQARRLTVAVGEALTWLRDSLAADIPEWVLTGLRAGPRLSFEHAVHRISTRPPTKVGFAVQSFDRYRRFAKLAPAEGRPSNFAQYLRAAWGLDHSRQVLIHGSRKLTSGFRS